MRKERFIYNTQTLRYEKVVEPLSTTVLRVFGFMCAAILTAFVITMVTHEYFPSPKEKEMARQIAEMNADYQQQLQQVEQITSVTQKLVERDANTFRAVLGMEPVDQSILLGGIGGHDHYAEYEKFGTTGDLMASLAQKIDQVRYQLNVQSQSYEEIIGTVTDKETELATRPSIKPIRSDQLAKGVTLLSGFGRRMHPVFKVMRMHNGIDFTAKAGTHIQATADGIVRKANRVSGFGLRVVIEHGDSKYETLYAHMSRIDVKVGQSVTRGQKIGLVGSTGTSTAPHCHYEVHYNGAPVNPINFVMDGLSPSEYQALKEAAEKVNFSYDEE